MTEPTRLAMRRLHRQRRRRATPSVLNSAELAEHFQVPVAALKEALDAAGWRYHEDANGELWASAPPADPRC